MAYLIIVPILDARGYVEDWRPREVIFADDPIEAITEAKDRYGITADVRETV